MSLYNRGTFFTSPYLSRPTEQSIQPVINKPDIPSIPISLTVEATEKIVKGKTVQNKSANIK